MKINQIYFKKYNKSSYKWKVAQLDFSGEIQILGDDYLVIPIIVNGKKEEEWVAYKTREVAYTTADSVVKYNNKVYELVDKDIMEILARNLKTIFAIDSLK
jgi:hypothetical protein